MKDLDLTHNFGHGDEHVQATFMQVYARLAHIIWKNPELYRNITTLIGIFHELRVRQETIYKRHALRGYQKWVIDPKTIAPGLSDAAIEGRHYYRNIRIIKEMFCALVQYRVKELTNDYNDMDMTLKSLFLNLRRKPLNLILGNNEFKNLFGKNLNDSHGTESKMTVCFLRDVSTLLAMAFAARDNFERHLQAEIEMIKYCFTFDHINYSWCLTYQHVYLRTLQERSKAVADLDERGFGGSLSGLPFTGFQTKRSWFYHRYKQSK